MKSKSFIFLIALVFMIVFSLSAVSADDLQTADSGQVSGDVDVVAENPYTTSGELTYDIPADAKDIKSADVYVNVYSGSAKNTYGANANVSLKTVNGENQIASEELWIENGTSDGTVYPVNDHVDKCYSDYQMRYDITNSLKGLNGTSISIKVDTFEMTNKSFDGKIKLIALVLAYDDGDADEINYWIDSAQRWTKTNLTFSFDTAGVTDIEKADLTDIVLSSANGNFTLNGELLGEPDNHTAGSTYQYNYWDVTDKISEGKNTEIMGEYAGTSAYGSLKNVLTVLKIQSTTVSADVSFNTEYTSVPTCYAGTNNTLTVKVKANKAGKYMVELLSDDGAYETVEVELDGENETTLLLTDPTIRPIDETTVKGANNTEVKYTVDVSYNGTVVGKANKTVPVLFNGYLDYRMEYPYNGGFLTYYDVITGDVVIDIQDEASYLAAGVMNRTDVWTVNLTEDSTIYFGFIYVPFNWFNTKDYNQTDDMFNVTFNGVTLEPYDCYWDQGNLGNYGGYGYGTVIYEVAEFLNTGENTLVLNKKYATPAVYPSVLFYGTNVPGGSFKEIHLNQGADLLSNDYNKAGRIVKTDNSFYLDDTDFVNTTLYILAAGAQAGEGNIIFNGKEFTDVWSGTSKSTDLFTVDVNDLIEEDLNNISFVATGSTILALPQVVVCDAGYSFSIDSIKTEYTSVPCVYAGTNNTLTVTVNSSIDGEFLIDLWVDLRVMVDNLTVNLTKGINIIELTDPTIRQINEFSVNGADHVLVNYMVDLWHNDWVFNKNITVPVLYNGYLGYDMEYNVTGFENFYEYFSGEFVVDVQDAGTYLGASAMNRTDVWTVNLDEDSEIAGAILIVPYNWFNTKLYNETDDMFTVTFNGNTIAPSSHYRDQGNLGNYGGYGYGILAYNVTDILNVSGDNTLVLNKNNPTPAVYPSALVYWTNNPRGNFKELHYVLGADLLSNDYNKAGRVVKADTVMGVLIDEFANTTLYALAAGAQKGEGNIIFNEHEYADVWDGTDKSTELVTLDVSEFFTETNYISFVATGSTVLALPQFIVADAGYYYVIDDVKTEYTSVPCVYAGTNNTFTLTVTTNLPGEYEVGVFIYNEGELNRINVNLTNGTNIIQITDPTIRPINESTVNGANNTLINYGFEISIMDNYVYSYPLTLPVLYNGNFGKDLEYNATYIEDIEVYPVTGGVQIQTQDASTYMSASALNRTDIFDIELDNASSLEKAFVYIAYNWDKTGVNGPVFNVTFNGNAVTPKSSYRDQSNLGNYGKYGYGLFIYDVTEFAQENDNTLFISKESGLTAVYPSNFIYLYNTEGSNVLTTVYMANGADLLSNSYNNAGRIVKTTANIPDVNFDIADALLYVFAASAQKGEGNIVFNGNEKVDVWSGTSNTLDTYVADVTETLAPLNDIEFVATGSTILALNQMIVTQTIVKVIPEVNIIVPSEVKAGDDVAVTISIPDVVGDAYILVDEEFIILPLENGTASFIMENVSEGIHGVGVFYPGDDFYLPGSGIKFFEVEGLPTPIPTEITDIVVNDDLNISFVLKDEVGRPVANATIVYVINGTINTTVTAADGSFVIAAINGIAINVGYFGNETLLPALTMITVNVPAVPTVVKVESQFNITGGVITLNGYAVDTKAGEEGIYYATELLDAKGNPIKGAKIQFAVNDKIYNRTTNENGSFN
ncbi:DUF3344 domain-containing protein, partial [Methanobrevibacter sp.]|uniref:DUF3344 domain-containing protein n=1 Tax=Methanobrevibacter sp. TaxID=66852 RepID=UPI003864529E